MNFTKRITTAIATGAVLLSSLAPMASADMNLTISGNGSNSDSSVNVSSTTNHTVVQTNNANVTNNITTNATTGNNKANDNAGKDTSVKTGDVTTAVNVTNTVNTNQADVKNCNCNTNQTVNVSGNATHSDNDVKLDTGGTTTVFQNNNANIGNTITTTANSGNNDANRNTDGDTSVKTGNVSANVTVNTTANANIAQVGGADEDGGSLSLTISHNGSHSDNSIKVNNDPSTTISQDNEANVTNNVNSILGTGKNDANDNNGGDTKIKTGDAAATVGIDNTVNFNAADVLDCGCATNVNASIDTNNTDSKNKISADLGGSLYVDQGYGKGGNNADLNNNVTPTLQTGDNKANDNNGDEDDSVITTTGDSTSNVSVDNTANENVYGDVPSFGLPGNSNVSINFDLSQLLGMLHLI